MVLSVSCTQKTRLETARGSVAEDGPPCMAALIGNADLNMDPTEMKVHWLPRI
jgi:hypothetical protein